MFHVLLRPAAWLRERLPDAVTLLALAFLCWVLARWTWVVLAPTPPPVPPVERAPVNIQAALDEVLRAKLFSSEPAVPQAPVASVARDVQLAGVLATGAQGRGWAVLQLGEKAHQVAIAGAEVAPDLVLHQVFADHVVLRRNGSLERVALARRSAAASAAEPVARLDVKQRGIGDYAFSRADLERALREPGQLKNLGALSFSAEGGVQIEQAPPGSLAERLGLRAGDVIRSVNGQRIQGEDDLRRLYEQFNQTRQTAWVVFEGRRSEAPLRLRYTVQP